MKQKLIIATLLAILTGLGSVSANSKGSKLDALMTIRAYSDILHTVGITKEKAYDMGINKDCIFSINNYSWTQKFKLSDVTVDYVPAGLDPFQLGFIKFSCNNGQKCITKKERKTSTGNLTLAKFSVKGGVKKLVETRNEYHRKIKSAFVTLQSFCE